MSNRIVAVFGATGTQGASVVNALLADGTFKPRAITRNTSSDAALDLKNRGCEVVKADLLDAESVKAALVGCECVYGVTDAIDASLRSQGTDTEVKVGKSLVDSAKEAGVQFFVWSSLPNVSELSKGKYKNVYHFDNKAVIEEYLRQSGLPNATLRTGYFAENLWKFNQLQKADSGYDLVLSYGKEAILPFSWITQDLGPCALALFKNYKTHQEISGSTYHVVYGNITVGELAQTLERALGVPVKYKYAPAPMLEMVEMSDFIEFVGMYPGVEIPDPYLVDLGVKFSSPDEFAESVKSKYA